MKQSVKPPIVVWTDGGENIRGAVEIGMQTVHCDVTRPEASYAEALKKLGH